MKKQIMCETVNDEYFISDRQKEWLCGKSDPVVEAVEDYIENAGKFMYPEHPEAGVVSDYIGLDDIAEGFGMTVDQLMLYCKSLKNECGR